MSEFLENNLRTRGYRDSSTDLEIFRFEEEPEIDCYKRDESDSSWHVKFKIGAIIHGFNEQYDIVYAKRASDGCAAFGPQRKDRTDYLFEYKGVRYSTVCELLQQLLSKNDLLYNVESDDFDDI